MLRRNDRLLKKLVFAFFLLLLPTCLVAASPQITDIQPANAVGGQQIRIIGTGFPVPSGYAASTRVFFRQGEYSASAATMGTTTEIWVTLPSGLVVGEVSIKVSNLANVSQPFTYTVGSARLAPVARSSFPATPYPGQRTYIAVDGFSYGSYSSGSGSGTIFEIRQGEALFCAQAEPARAAVEPERSAPPRVRHDEFAPEEPTSDELISTISPASVWGGGVIGLPPELVAGPATIRAGYQFESDPILWGPALPFTVASTPTPITLVEAFRDSVAPGQQVFLLTDSPPQSGLVGDPDSGSRMLEFSQGSVSYEKTANSTGPYVFASLPEGLSPGAASVRLKTSFTGSGVVVYSNSVSITVNTSPLRPTVTGWGNIDALGGYLWAGYYYAMEFVPFPTGAGKNLIRMRQGNTVYEVAPSGVWNNELDFPRPPGLSPGFAEVSVISTYGTTAAQESNRVPVEVLGSAPVLTSLSSSTALGGQHLWALGSDFSKTSNQVRFYQGGNWESVSTYVNEPDALSFEVPPWLDAGSYQVAVANGAGESARLTLEIGSTAAPVQVLSCPASLGVGEYFMVRVSGARSSTLIDIAQGDNVIGGGNWWTRGMIGARLYSGMPAGSASIVLTTDLGGSEPVVTTRAFTVSVSPDPPVLSPSFWSFGVPAAGVGQSVNIRASGISESGMSAEITQGSQVVTLPIGYGSRSVTIGIPASLQPGTATVRVKATYNGVETGWSNSVPMWISELPSVGTLYLPSLFVPSKQTYLELQGITPGAEVEAVFSGEAEDWVVDQFFDQDRTGYRLFTPPADVPPGFYLFRARTRPAESADFSPWTKLAFVEVAPGAVANANLAMGDADAIEVPFGAGFTFPFASQTWDRVWIGANGDVTFGGPSDTWGYFGFVDDSLPRIAPLWSDFDATYDGSIRFEQYPSWFDVVYEAVPQWSAPANLSTVRLRLFPDGRFDFIYGEIQTGPAIFVGFTQGGPFTDPGETDFSSLDLTRGIGTGTESSIYQNLWGEEFDLDNLTLHFAANGRQATGYTILGTDGGVFAFGGSEFYGSLPAIGLVPNAPLSNLTLTTSEQGYYMMGLDGGVFCFGDAQFLGSLPGLGISNQTIDLEAVPGGQGYYLLGPDGGVFAFGTAEFHGSLPGVGVVNTALDMEITPSGQGYWILGIDGGIFAFGDAQFYGSLPQLGVAPVAPLKRIKSTPDGRGYCLLGEDGGVFAFGNANFWGSLPSLGVVNQAVDLEITPNNQGYYMLGVDGGIFSFGDAGFFGSLPGMGIATTTLDMEVKTNR